MTKIKVIIRLLSDTTDIVLNDIFYIFTNMFHYMLEHANQYGLVHICKQSYYFDMQQT